MTRIKDKRPAPENLEDSCVGHEIHVWTDEEVAKYAYRVKKTHVILTCESVEDIKDRVRDWYDELQIAESSWKEGESHMVPLDETLFEEAERKLDRWDGDESITISGGQGEHGGQLCVEIFCRTWTPSITWSNEVSKTPTVKAARV